MKPGNFLNRNGAIEQLGIGIVVTANEFYEILKESRRTCPGPDTICYELLKDLPKNVIDLACLFISSSRNNSIKLERLSDPNVTKTRRRPVKNRKLPTD